MALRKSDIVRPDRRVAAQLQTLAYIFDISPTQLRRMLHEHGIAGSDRFGPTLYRVDEVEKALFPVDRSQDGPAGFATDPSVGAVHEAAKRGNRRADAA